MELPRHGAAVAKKAWRADHRAPTSLTGIDHSFGSLAIHRWQQWTHGFASPPYDGFAFFANQLTVTISDGDFGGSAEEKRSSARADDVAGTEPDNQNHTSKRHRRQKRVVIANIREKRRAATAATDLDRCYLKYL